MESSALALDRTKPWQRRFAEGAERPSSSKTSKLQLIEGKAISSSTCCEALVKSLISKEPQDPMVVRERFRLFDAIMGRLLRVVAFAVCFRASSRAAVADIVVCFCFGVVVLMLRDIVRGLIKSLSRKEQPTHQALLLVCHVYLG